MTIHTDPDRQHAVYSPSSAHRWGPDACTASAEAIDRLPEQEEGEEAAEGTEAHHEIEHLLGSCNGVTMDPAAVIPAAQKALDRDHPAAYGIALVLDYVRQLPPGTLWIEQRVALTPEIWGRCDVSHWDPITATVTIVDYKNGFVGIDAEKNEQLLIYAAGSIFTHHLPAKWVRLVVVQPNDFRPVPRVKQWVTDTTDLHAFASRMAMVPSGPKSFVLGEHCDYCPLFGRCPVSKDVLVRLSSVQCHPPDQVPVAQRAIFDAIEKPVVDWFKIARKAWTKDALGKGLVPPGMKLVTAQTHRAWKDPVVARAAVVEKCGVDALELPTPAQAEKLGVDVSTLADKPPGGPVLAPANDSRKPWGPPSVADMAAGVRAP